MKTTTPAPRSTGLSLPAVLTVVFVVLKLTGLVSWPWIWVLSPVWMPAALLAVCIAIAVPIVAAAAYRRAKRELAAAEVYADAAPQCRYCHKHATQGRLCDDHAQTARRAERVQALHARNDARAQRNAERIAAWKGAPIRTNTRQAARLDK